MYFYNQIPAPVKIIKNFIIIIFSIFLYSKKTGLNLLASDQFLVAPLGMLEH